MQSISIPAEVTHFRIALMDGEIAVSFLDDPLPVPTVPEGGRARVVVIEATRDWDGSKFGVNWQFLGSTAWDVDSEGSCKKADEPEQG